MLQYNDKNKVTGVIVTAQGADDPVVKSNIVKGCLLYTSRCV